MLYQLQEASYDLAGLWRPLVATIGGSSLLGKYGVAQAELFDRLTRRWEKPSFRLDHTMIDGRAVDVVEEIVVEKPFGTLLRFRRDTSLDDPKLLLVAPMSGHYATMIRGTIEAVLPDHDVYVTDWANARDVPRDAGSFDLDDYILYVREFLEILGPDTHVLAVCQAAVPTLSAVALMSEDRVETAPKTLALMAGPIDTRISPNQVTEVAEKFSIEWFEKLMLDTVPGRYAGAGRRVRPGFMQLGAFLAMNLSRHVESHVDFFWDVVSDEDVRADVHREFYDEYFAVMDVTGEFYLQTVASVFQEHELARGIATWRGRPLVPAAITRTALMTIEGGKDDIAGLGQTEAAHTLCTALPPEMRHHYVQPDVGHYGVFNGRRWREEIAPEFAAFIREHR